MIELPFNCSHLPLSFCLCLWHNSPFLCLSLSFCHCFFFLYICVLGRKMEKLAADFKPKSIYNVATLQLFPLWNSLSIYYHTYICACIRYLHVCVGIYSTLYLTHDLCLLINSILKCFSTFKECFKLCCKY